MQPGDVQIAKKLLFEKNNCTSGTNPRKKEESLKKRYHDHGYFNGRYKKRPGNKLK